MIDAKLSYKACKSRTLGKPFGIQAKIVGCEVRFLHSDFSTEKERDDKLKDLRKRKK